MTAFRIVRDTSGHVVRVEYGGVVLPVEEFDFEYIGGRVRLRLMFEGVDVDYVVSDRDAEVVDADPPHKLLEASHDR